MNLTGVFITYKKPMIPRVNGTIGFLYNFNLSDSNKILVILNYNKKNLAFRCFTLIFDKFVFYI